MNTIEDKQVSIVGLKSTERPYISKIIKKAGGVFGKSFKSTEIFIKGPYILRSNNLDDFSRKNPNVKVIPLDELYKHLDMDEQIPYVEHIYDRYDMHTKRKKDNLEHFANLYWDTRYVTEDRDLYFNDDLCTDFETTFINWDVPDSNLKLFVEALKKVGVFKDESDIWGLIGAPEFDSVADYFWDKNKCWSFLKLAAIALAIKHFVDPSFCVRFRIYRDKWEYRGDYPGMVSSVYEIPPILHWKLDEEYPCGHLEVTKYTSL